MSFHAVSAEVAVIDDIGSSSEISIAFTDEALYAAMNKAWAMIPCKTRFNFTPNYKVTATSSFCRAEVVKFILDSGYKPLDSFGRVFTK